MEAVVETSTLAESTSVNESTDGLTILVFSGDLDKVLSAFIIADGAAAMDMPVTMLFTFWGLNVLRRDGPVKVNKGLVEKMFGWMMPRGPSKLTLSKMNMLGMGTKMMKDVMKKRNVYSLPKLMELAKESGVKLIACTMSMDIMGITEAELIDGVELGGVVSFLDSASRSKTTLFIS